MFVPIAFTITFIATITLIGDIFFPAVFRVEPQFFLYCYVGLYLFSVAYEAVSVIGGKPE